MSTDPQNLRQALLHPQFDQLVQKQPEAPLEQYHHYVAIMDQTSQRRLQTNGFFLTLNSGLAMAMYYLCFHTQITHDIVFILPLWLAALTICGTWFRLSWYYQQLHSARFKVIAEMEEKLPFRTFVKAEWEFALQRKPSKWYLSFSSTERLVPIIFGLAYTLWLIFYTIYV